MPTLADVLRQTGYAQDGTLATPTPTKSPMTKALADHLASIPQKFNENQAHQMELLGKAFPGNTYESMMTQGDPKAMAELAMQTPFNAMIAYHGTPHKILGGFDINKVGTGEGAQAYGHGMYFAENPAVAKEYQDFLGKKISVGGTPIYEANKRIGKTGDSLVDDMIVANLGDIDKSIKMAKEGYQDIISKNPEGGKDFYNAWKKLEEYKNANQIETKSTGNLYKVDIPDEHIPNMLDWDKPLSEQSQAVKDALANIPHRGKDWTFKDTIETLDAAPHLLEDVTLNPTGKEIYSLFGDSLMVGNKAPGQVEASKKLNELGIKGIRYLDEGSRNVPKPDIEYYAKGVEKLKELYKKQPTETNKFALDDAMQKLESVKRSQKDITSNFVVFDPSTVKILEENGKPLTRKELIEEQVNKLKD